MMNEWYQIILLILWFLQIYLMKYLLLDIVGSLNIWICKFFLNLYVILKVYFIQKILKYIVKQKKQLGDLSYKEKYYFFYININCI